MSQLPVLTTPRLTLHPISLPCVDGAAVFTLNHRNSGVIGVVGLRSRGAGAPELCYWLGEPFRGRGLMTEAVNVAVHWAHTGWRRTVLAAGHFADDPAAAGVLIKAGFLYTGIVEPRWSVLRGERAPTRMMVRLA